MSYEEHIDMAKFAKNLERADVYVFMLPLIMIEVGVEVVYMRPCIQVSSGRECPADEAGCNYATQVASNECAR